MAQASFEPGAVLDGRFELLRRIGAGGMGEVFLARRVALGDLVAVKCLLPAQDTAENRARFLGEARAAAHIHHPNVVRVYDFGDVDGAPYLVMEHLDGPTLADELGVRTRLDAADAVALFAPMCAAIEAGHRRQVVHRDLKPANVILARADDDSRVVKVLDFGLAIMATRAGTRLTSPGTIVGTCSYMAPEQVAGDPATPATDLFALGVILYEMITGVLPFDGDNQLAVMFKISQGAYRPAHAWVDDVPASVTAAIDAALQPDPARRPTSAEQLAAIALGGAATRTSAVRVSAVRRAPPTTTAASSATAPPRSSTSAAPRSRQARGASTPRCSGRARRRASTWSWAATPSWRASTPSWPRPAPASAAWRWWSARRASAARPCSTRSRAAPRPAARSW
ncbi:MAG: serine/threonine protein kinase [Kofleriaceae bacterium]|nr:serine/threonine protein kinase [Kofleriaceae bacterium]